LENFTKIFGTTNLVGIFFKTLLLISSDFSLQFHGYKTHINQPQSEHATKCKLDKDLGWPPSSNAIQKPWKLLYFIVTLCCRWFIFIPKRFEISTLFAMISKTFEAKRTPPQKQAHLTAFSITSPGMLEIVHLLSSWCWNWQNIIMKMGN